MAQQPNVELDRSDAPKADLPTPAGRWSPTRPGEVLTPDAQVIGAGFGRPGPDIGFAYKLISHHVPAEDRSRRLDDVMVAIMGARASAIGRAPVAKDAAVAAALLGFGPGERRRAEARRKGILDSTAHEHSAGNAFVASIPPEVLHGEVDGAREWVDKDPSRRLDAVLVAVINARAAALGRAPERGDAEVAMAVLGLGPDETDASATRRQKVLDETFHEFPPGTGFAASIPDEVLTGDLDDAKRWAAGQTS
jgi:hypothetical protein